MKKSQKIIIVVIILIVIAGVSIGVALWMSQPKPVANQDTPSGTSLPATERPEEKKAAAAEKLANTGDVKGGTQALDEAIENTQDSHEKFVYYSQKATLLLNDGQSAAALEPAKQAFEIEKSSASASLVAQVAEAAGDRAVALEYYKKAVELIDTSDPMADEDKRYYSAKVSELEGK